MNKKRSWLKITAALLLAVFVGVFAFRDILFFTFVYNGTRAEWELQQTMRRVAQEATADESAVRVKCRQIADSNPDSTAIAANLYLLLRWPESFEGRAALQELALEAKKNSLSEWRRATNLISQVQAITRLPALESIGKVLIDRVEAEGDHPDAAAVLGKVACMIVPDKYADSAPKELAQIAMLIEQRYATSPDLANFCEIVAVRGEGDAGNWTHSFEPTLRKILQVNEDRFVRCSALFALAASVRSDSSRQVEARKLYERFLDEFDGKTDYHAKSVEAHYRALAENALAALTIHGIGMPAPPTVGIDLEGNPLSLADYRGQVVLVSFWASDCGPCLIAVPHERALLDEFQNDGFAILGINGDRNTDAAKEAATTHGIVWRSMQMQSHLNDWHIVGFPTFYLIGRDGSVVRSWMGFPENDDLHEGIQMAVKGEVSINSVVSKVDRPELQEPGVQNQSLTRSVMNAPIDVAIWPNAAHGFVERTLESSDGTVCRYVVFIPKDVQQGRTYPAILFLHSAGVQGSDGRQHLIGLAPEVNRRKDSFPFFVIFPQAPDSDWQVKTGHGRLALNVLEDVMRDFPIAVDRVALSGVSMGGEGTWQLAAAYPDRWSAIVPMCGGGDPDSVTQFVHIPCWCFQGGSDPSTNPELSRRMVRAIRQAGGQPSYTEYPDVGHDVWTQAYSSDQLYDWLAAQRRRVAAQNPRIR